MNCEAGSLALLDCHRTMNKFNIMFHLLARTTKTVAKTSAYTQWPVRIYNLCESIWTSPRVQRLAEQSLVFLFLISLIVIELRRQGLIPAQLEGFIPSKHFYAIQVAFGALLLYEVTGLVFGLARSVANALGLQLEIFSLILLRSSFEELVYFDEPVQWEQLLGKVDGNPVLHLIADAFGALAVFVLLGLYYRMQRHQPITEDVADRASFVAAKKTLALGLLAGYLFIGLNGLWQLRVGVQAHFFESFFTLLIFCDLLVVLISIRYTTTYRVVFRNSAFAVATILIRLALTAPPYYKIMIGITAAAFSVVLTLAYNTFSPFIPQAKVDQQSD